METTLKTGVLLVNLGTPDSTEVKDVRRYLREFLMDGRVIDIPYPLRWLLVNGIISTFRAPKSAREYRKLWEDRGSPLLFYGQDVTAMLQEALGEGFVVKLAMRYQNPSIDKGLEALRNAQVDKIVVVPLFPQYASATTGSVIDKVMAIARTWQTIPSIEFVSNFVDDELFLDAFAQNGKKYLQQAQYDHVIFSYHGVPERHIRKGSMGNHCQLSDACCSQYGPENKLCYRAQCFYTSRQLAKRLGLANEQYTTTFQSRLGKDPWVQPYTDDVLKQLPGKGKKKVLVFSPAFIADCLETTVEVGQEFKEEFEHAGGEEWQLVESLNASPLWVECLKNLVERHAHHALPIEA